MPKLSPVETSEPNLTLTSHPFPEALKPVLSEAILGDFYLWNLKDTTSLPGMVKWSLDLGKESGVPFDPAKAKAQILGMARGFIGERVSGAVGIATAQTCFGMDVEVPEGTEMIDPTQVLGGPNKSWILKEALARGFAQSPLKYPELFVDPYNPNIDAYMLKLQSELVAGLVEVSPNINKKLGEKELRVPSGEFYEFSTIPDAFLRRNGDLVGFIEVKAYTQHEVEELLAALKGGKHGYAQTEATVTIGKTEMHLGMNLDKEVEFIDFYRSQVGDRKENMEPLGREMVMVLRFPADIKDDTLKELGEYYRSIGYPNVVVQKLAFTSEEMNTQALQLLKSQLPTMEQNSNPAKGKATGSAFSKRELNCIKELTEGIEA